MSSRDEVISLVDSSDEEEEEDFRPSCSIRNMTRPRCDQDSDDDNTSDRDSDDIVRSGRRNSRYKGPESEHESNTRNELISSSETDESDSKHPLPCKTQGRETFKRLLKSMEDADDIQLLYPKSLHPDFEYEDEIWDERDVLADLISADLLSDEEDEEEDIFEELIMTDFSIYRGVMHHKGFHGQFESPHVISSEQDSGMFYIDGVVSDENRSRRIIGAVICDVNIGGLNDLSYHTTAEQIWVQSNLSRSRQDCWYRLYAPSGEYSTTWRNFLFLADLNKHVIDYLCDASSKLDKIHLRHFETFFWQKLEQWHGHDQCFKFWAQQAATTDFRMHITIHAAFLRDQAWSVSGQVGFDTRIRGHPVWEEIGAGEINHDQQRNSKTEKTVVTPNIGSTFLRAFPNWGPAQYNLLRSIPLSLTAATHRQERQMRLGFPETYLSDPTSEEKAPSVTLLLERAATRNETSIAELQNLVGKVIVVRSLLTDESSGIQSSDSGFRFALVREIINSEKTVRVCWLLLPTATTCGDDYDKTFYPVPNELFFSDECNCKPVKVSQIVAVHTVSIVQSAPDAAAEIAIQLLYRHKDSTFVTPVVSELLCNCQYLRSARSFTSTSSQQQQQRNTSQLVPKLRTMSLYSGCGLLDYGLDESTFFETVYALDHNEMAIRSHAANSKSERCEYVVGSVNTQLEDFLCHKTTFPDIDCITAGCPCQGFSLLNAHRAGENAQRNCSLLASTLSWIDLFLPRYAIIENVPTMDHTPSDNDRANACGQAICCLVAMGYQVRKMFLNAYDYGSPTIRRRLFLVAAAPGLRLPAIPEASHGEGYGLKPILTVADVIKGLKPLHNDSVINVQDPSHIPIQRLRAQLDYGVSLRNVLKRIHKLPREGLVQAYQKGLLSRDQRIWFLDQSDEKQGEKSCSLRRVDPNSPFKTIVTVISPLDSRFGGEIVHPFEDRLLSLREICRAQGIPDIFLLVGNLRQQIELAGNGVAWQVGAAIGREIGASWTDFCVGGTDEESEKSKEALGNVVRTSSETVADFKESKHISRVSSPLQEESLSPRSDGAQLQQDLAEMIRHDKYLEEILEISDHESMHVAPDGTVKYQRDTRRTLSRRPSSGKRPKGEWMVVIPEKKRLASTTPPPPYSPRTNGNPIRDDSDSDVVFVKSIPVTKKRRYD